MAKQVGFVHIKCCLSKRLFWLKLEEPLASALSKPHQLPAVASMKIAESLQSSLKTPCTVQQKHSGLLAATQLLKTHCSEIGRHSLLIGPYSCCSCVQADL